MPSSDFRQLRVYRHAAALGDTVRGHVLRWPKFDIWSVGIQAIRAADSAGANIAEASGRWGRQDQQRFLFYARGSAYELEHWTERALQRNLPMPDNSEQQVRDLIRMLNGYIRADRRTP